jgi:hypothetical protein
MKVVISIFGWPGRIIFAREGLRHPKQFQYDEYDNDNDQNVNPTASARKTWTYVPTKKAEQPQYQ